MKFTELLNRIEQIRKESPKPATSGASSAMSDTVDNEVQTNQETVNDLLNSLLKSAKEYDSEGPVYIKQLVVGYGLGALLEEGMQPGFTIPQPNSANYNGMLYQKILPLCQLAYLEEKNGLATDHALKLSLIFNDENTVYDYLRNFTKSNQARFLVHDACNFDLPPDQPGIFSRWKAMANKRSSKNELNMQNPRFRELLPLATEIEEVAQCGQRRLVGIDKRIAKEKEVLAANAAYKKKENARMTNPTPEERAAHTTELTELSKTKSRLSLELAELSMGIPLEEASLILLQAFYELYKTKSSPAHRIFVQHGINTKNINVFNSLKRENSDQAIPALTIKGSDIDYPGYYLTKLDTQSDEGAALAACLGKITNDCQYLGGLGADCVKHGIESAFGGFYVLFKGDENNPKFTDRVLSQAWVWRSNTEGLCLDSIEATIQAKTEKKKTRVSDFYRYLGMVLCDEPGIRQVNTGAQSGITTSVALKNYPAPKLHSIDYQGYSDSKSQLLLADSLMPYIFYGQVSSETLQAFIRERTRVCFSQLFALPSELKNNEDLKKAIAYIIYSKQDKEDNSLFQLLLETADERVEELYQLIEVNRRYVTCFDDGGRSFDLFEQGAYINAINSLRQSALHRATKAANLTLVEQVISLGINLDIQDIHGNSALFDALEKNVFAVLYYNKSETCRAIAVRLIECGANIDLKDKDENTPLIIAVKDKDLDMVRYLIEKGADVDTYDANMKTAIYWAAVKGNLAIFKELLNKHPRMDMISLSDQENLLMAAVRGGNEEITGIISQVQVNLFHMNNNGETVLHLAANKPACLKVILELISQEHRFDAVNTADEYGRTALHLAAHNPECLKVILELMSQEQRFEVVKTVDRHDTTVLQSAAFNLESLKIILELYPQDQRFDAVNKIANHGKTVLHCTANRPESLKAILERIPQEQRLDALKIVDRDGCSVLSSVERNPNVMSIIHALVPQLQEQQKSFSSLPTISTSRHSIFSEATATSSMLSDDEEKAKEILMKK